MIFSFPSLHPTTFLLFAKIRVEWTWSNPRRCPQRQWDADRECVHPDVESILYPLSLSTFPSGQTSRAVLLQTFPTSLCQALQHLRYPPQLPTFPSWWKSSLMPSCVVPLFFCPSGGTKSHSELQRYCWLGIVNTISMKVNRDGTYGPLVSGMLIMVRCCITHSGLDPALWQVAVTALSSLRRGGWRWCQAWERRGQSVSLCHFV